MKITNNKSINFFFYYHPYEFFPFLRSYKYTSYNFVLLLNASKLFVEFPSTFITSYFRTEGGVVFSILVALLLISLPISSILALVSLTVLGF